MPNDYCRLNNEVLSKRRNGAILCHFINKRFDATDNTSGNNTLRTELPMNKLDYALDSIDPMNMMRTNKQKNGKVIRKKNNPKKMERKGKNKSNTPNISLPKAIWYYNAIIMILICISLSTEPPLHFLYIYKCIPFEQTTYLLQNDILWTIKLMKCLWEKNINCILYWNIMVRNAAKNKLNKK